MFVLVTCVNVAFVAVRVWRAEVPRTVSVPVTVEEEVRLPPSSMKVAVEVPPANWMAFVVVFPAFVTVCRFGVVPVGQFVPFARHTLNPFTSTAPAFKVVPDAVAKPSQEVEVPFVNERFVNVPLVPNKLVVVTLVPVAMVKVRP